jgi:hypothetical protein
MVSLTIQKKNASTKEGGCFYTTRPAKDELGVTEISYIFWMTFFMK